MENNCSDCLYSDGRDFLSIIDKLGSEHFKCNNENSPYYHEFVSDNMTCRLFFDYNKHVKRVDRKEKLHKLDNKK